VKALDVPVSCKEKQMLKRFALAAVVTVALYGTAYAGYRQCQTSCYWVGQQQYCNTQCY
jgi:hypothetical protein